MNVYAKQTESQIQKTNLWLTKGRGKWGGTKQGYGINRQTIMYKIPKQEGYIVQHREIQPLSCDNL